MFNISKNNINIIDARALINKGNVKVLDVRTKDEYKEGHIKGSINIDVMDEFFTDRVVSLDKGEKYIVYCGGGSRANKASTLMKNLGFGNLCILQKGIRGWNKKGLPIEK